VTAKIVVRDLTKTFHTRKATTTQALAGVSLEIDDGEFLCIVGPSGCGKTTLLRIMAALETPSTGSVEMRRSPARDRPLQSMVFQEHSLFPWLTVLDNVAFGLEMRGVPRTERTRRAGAFIEMVGLENFRGHYPHQLSGGMKQRLSLVRAWATSPELLLLDEPFAALDEQNKALLQQELVKLWEEYRSTVVFITHSLEEAVLLGDRVAVMTSAPGRIKEVVSVPFERPRALASLRRSGEFNQLVTGLWESLREEVERARAAELRALAGRVPETAGGGAR